MDIRRNVQINHSDGALDELNKSKNLPSRFQKDIPWQRSSKKYEPVSRLRESDKGELIALTCACVFWLVVLIIVGVFILNIFF